MLSELSDEKIPLRYNLDYLFKMGLFQGEDPEDRYNNAYFSTNPNKRPSQKIINKEQHRYDNRKAFIDLLLDRSDFNKVACIFFSSDLKEAVVYGFVNNENNCSHYVFENNHWVKALKNNYDSSKFKRNSCDPNNIVIIYRSSQHRKHNRN